MVNILYIEQRKAIANATEKYRKCDKKPSKARKFAAVAEILRKKKRKNQREIRKKVFFVVVVERKKRKKDISKEIQKEREKRKFVVVAVKKIFLVYIFLQNALRFSWVKTAIFFDFLFVAVVF